MSNDRREFLKKSALLGLIGLGNNLLGKEKLAHLESVSNKIAGSNDAFTLPKLPYAYNALEPFIDAKTMEIHYTKHHQAYINKLNETPSTNIDYSSSDEVKCTHIDKSTNALIRNNLGGHFNHSLFWTLMRKPISQTVIGNEVLVPVGSLSDAIKNSFNSFDEFRTRFFDTAMKRFGSGWTWLVINKDKKQEGTGLS